MPIITPAIAAALNCIGDSKKATALAASGDIDAATLKLDNARLNWRRAKSWGCPADFLAKATSAGCKAADAIADATCKAA